MDSLTAIITGKLVAFDTAPLIYYIEANPDYIKVADELFDSIDQGRTLGTTSMLTLLEVLVRPLRDGRFDLADTYRELLTNSANVTLHVINEAVAVRAAKLRGKYEWLRTPDAIQIATAIEHRAEILVTNDERWKRVTELEIIVLSEYLAPPP